MAEPQPQSRPQFRLGLKTLLILVSLLSISAMMGGLFITGVWIGESAQSSHRLNLLPFILATSMAPIGIPLAVYWVLRILQLTRQRP